MGWGGSMTENSGAPAGYYAGLATGDLTQTEASTHLEGLTVDSGFQEMLLNGGHPGHRMAVDVWGRLVDLSNPVQAQEQPAAPALPNGWTAETAQWAPDQAQADKASGGEYRDKGPHEPDDVVQIMALQ